MITLEELKAARERLGLSQNALAQKLGVDQTTVWGWEKNGLPKNKLILESLERRLRELEKAKAA